MFSLFDKDEDGVVKVTEIGPMLRSVGFNPSEVEIQRLQQEHDDHGRHAESLRPPRTLCNAPRCLSVSLSLSNFT